MAPDTAGERNSKLKAKEREKNERTAGYFDVLRYIMEQATEQRVYCFRIRNAFLQTKVDGNQKLLVDKQKALLKHNSLQKFSGKYLVSACVKIYH